jgi:hypothetical protein
LPVVDEALARANSARRHRLRRRPQHAGLVGGAARRRDGGEGAGPRARACRWWR